MKLIWSKKPGESSKHTSGLLIQIYEQMKLHLRVQHRDVWFLAVNTSLATLLSCELFKLTHCLWSPDNGKEVVEFEFTREEEGHDSSPHIILAERRMMKSLESKQLAFWSRNTQSIAIITVEIVLQPTRLLGLLPLHAIVKSNSTTRFWQLDIERWATTLNTELFRCRSC